MFDYCILIILFRNQIQDIRLANYKSKLIENKNDENIIY
jgi:hypothetical protein